MYFPFTYALSANGVRIELSIAELNVVKQILRGALILDEVEKLTRCWSTTLYIVVCTHN